MDSSNAERMAEAHDELAKLMSEKRLKDALLLVYANKQVLSSAVNLNGNLGVVWNCRRNVLRVICRNL